MNRKDTELQLAESVRETKSWSWKKWANTANDYLPLVDKLFSPDVLVIGGGIAKEADAWQELLNSRAPLRVAALGDQAGIVGAAMTAHHVATRARRATGGTPPDRPR